MGFSMLIEVESEDTSCAHTGDVAIQRTVKANRKFFTEFDS